MDEDRPKITFSKYTDHVRGSYFNDVFEENDEFYDMIFNNLQQEEQGKNTVKIIYKLPHVRESKLKFARDIRNIGKNLDQITEGPKDLNSKQVSMLYMDEQKEIDQIPINDKLNVSQDYKFC